MQNNDDLVSHLEQRAREILPPLNKPKNYIPIVAVVCLYLVLIFSLAGGIRISNTTKIGDTITNKQTTVITTGGKDLKPWGDLPLEARQALKDSARKACPEINDIGSGTSWDCAREYLEAQGIHANNVRDLFR